MNDTEVSYYFEVTDTFGTEYSIRENDVLVKHYVYYRVETTENSLFDIAAFNPFVLITLTIGTIVILRRRKRNNN